MSDDGEGFFRRIRPNAEWDVVRTILLVLVSQMLPGLYAFVDSSPSLKVGILLSALGIIGAIGLAIPRGSPVKPDEWRSMSEAFKGLTEIEGRYKLFLASDMAEWTFDHGDGTDDPGKPIRTFMEHATKAGALLRRAIGDSRDPGYPALSFWMNIVMTYEAHGYPTHKYVDSGSRIEQGTVEDLCSKSAYLCARLEHEQGLLADIRRWNTAHKSKAKRIA